MRNGVCPKCSAQTVHAGRDCIKEGGTHVSIQAHIEPGFRGIRPNHQPAGVWQFVCTTCGYLESYLLDAGSIDFVRQNWLQVPAT